MATGSYMTPIYSRSQSPSNCGNPDRQENSTILEKDFRLGQSVTYQCPTGNKVVGDRIRRCESSGFWSGSAPSCEFVDCGTLKNINFGKVTYADDRTTYNATAMYVCDENYTLVGSGTRRCAEDGKWNGTEPRCECKFLHIIFLSLWLSMQSALKSHNISYFLFNGERFCAHLKSLVYYFKNICFYLLQIKL
ncbi:UNVERIFIED_CONTAM: Sushi, von Willebrand factor type A, EGF and pentraxin domain-containing protein 1 [Trichonephila clavipes]